MKNRHILSIICIASLGYCNAGALNTYIGAHVGVSLMDANIYSGNNNIGWQNSADLPFVIKGSKIQATYNIGISGGIRYYFNKYIGIRSYLKYDYSNFRDILDTSKISTEDLSANIDMLIDFWRGQSVYFGAFAGFGVGYEIIQWSNSATREKFSDMSNYNGFILPVNVGFYIGINQHHMIELNANIKTFNVVTNFIGTNTGISVTPYIINIGYSYIF